MQNSAKIVLQEVIELDTLETLLNGRLKSPHYFGQNSEIDKKKDCYGYIKSSSFLIRKKSRLAVD